MGQRLRQFGLLGAALLLLCAAQAQSASPTPPATPAVAPAAAVATTISVVSHPRMLPNDGYSEAQIKVQVSDDNKPQAGKVVKASVLRGGGSLIQSQATTDASGTATFAYRAGLSPEAGEVAIVTEDAGTSASVKIPLAPVTYIDVTLVTPTEYQAYLKRQVAAAPIYTLSISAFPEQLAADGGSMATLTATLKQTNGKPAAGVPLLAELLSGDGDIIAEQVATDAAGHLRFYYIAGFTPGTATIRVTEPSTGLVKAQTILLVEAGPARVELLYREPLTAKEAKEGALLPADGSTELPLVAEVTDLSGLPLSGVELHIDVFHDTNGWVEVNDPVSDVQGRVEFSYHAGNHVGDVRLRAFVADGI